ncbi:MAG: YiiX/YebB-like N1pC/P60 family cysteine hydrolase [Hyphomonadaceae bacterium]
MIRALAAALSTLALASAAPANAPRAERHAPIAQPVSLEPGDIVFIGVDGAFWADLASASSDQRFGHVGIAARDERGRMLIVHAGGAPDRDNAPVVAELFPVFAADASRVGIYRASDRLAAERAAHNALNYARSGAQFDGAFSLETRDRLYCTELVWRAYDERIARPSTMGTRAVIALRDIERSDAFEQIAVRER